jgi:hypothetical protein
MPLYPEVPLQREWVLNSLFVTGRALKCFL